MVPHACPGSRQGEQRREQLLEQLVAILVQRNVHPKRSKHKPNLEANNALEKGISRNQRDQAIYASQRHRGKDARGDQSYIWLGTNQQKYGTI